MVRFVRFYQQCVAVVFMLLVGSGFTACTYAGQEESAAPKKTGKTPALFQSTVPGIPAFPIVTNEIEKESIFAAPTAVVLLFYDTSNEKVMSIGRQQANLLGLESLNFPAVWFRGVDVSDETGWSKALFQKVVPQGRALPTLVMMTKKQGGSGWVKDVCEGDYPSGLAVTKWIAGNLRDQKTGIEPKVVTLTAGQEVTTQNANKLASANDKSPIYTLFYAAESKDVGPIAEEQKGELALAQLVCPSIRFRFVNVSNPAEQAMFESIVIPEKRKLICHMLQWSEPGAEKFQSAVLFLSVPTAGMVVDFIEGKLKGNQQSFGTTSTKTNVGLAQK